MTLAEQIAKQAALQGAMVDLEHAVNEFDDEVAALLRGAGPDHEYAEAVSMLADRARSMVTVWKETHDA
jgi:hypothetical protein